MSGEHKMKGNKQKKQQDGTFHSKNVKHDPQAESARAKFGLNTISDGERKGG
jgi:hypothetical protein